jgi:hypothetical protein
MSDAARRQHWQRRDRVDHLGHERHRAHHPHMTAAVGALGHDDIRASLSRRPRPANLKDHVHHDAARGVRLVENRRQRLVDARPGERRDPRPLGQHRGDGLIRRIKEEQVEPERRLSEGTDAIRVVVDLLRAHSATTEDTQPSGIAHRGHKLRGGAGRTQAAQDDRVPHADHGAKRRRQGSVGR